MINSILRNWLLLFVNMSADPENEYFSDGITEELLNALTKVDGLQVTSRTSAFAFKGKNTDIRDIGIQLNVDRLLEGSVRKAGNRVRITAQLINATDGYHIWSEVYDRDLTDIFKVQDEISGIIANKLRENLTAREHEETLVKVPTKNLEAYTLVLKGLHFYNKITPHDAKKALECFEKAITLEPGYANAYAMAATAYAFLGATGEIEPKEAFEVVHRYSDKALQKNEAVDIMEKAYQIDPLSVMVNESLTDAYTNAGRTEDALKQAELLLEIYPQMGVALELKGWCIGVKGDWKKAAEIFEEVHRLHVDHPLKALFPLGCAYANSGQVEKALECIRKIEQMQIEGPGTVLDAYLAMIWSSLGETDKAFHHFFQRVERKIGPVALIIDHHMFKVPRDDPRYKLLKEKLNLIE